MVFHLLWYVNQIICVRELQVKIFSSGRFKLQFQVKVSFKCNLHAKDNIYLYYILSSSPWGDSYSIDDPLPLCFYPSPPYLPPLCWRRAESYAISDKLKALKELTGDHPQQLLTSDILNPSTALEGKHRSKSYQKPIQTLLKAYFFFWITEQPLHDDEDGARKGLIAGQGGMTLHHTQLVATQRSL